MAVSLSGRSGAIEPRGLLRACSPELPIPCPLPSKLLQTELHQRKPQDVSNKITQEVLGYQWEDVVGQERLGECWVLSYIAL